MHIFSRTRRTLGLLICLLLLAGCKSTYHPPYIVAPINQPSGDPPAYGKIVEGYNRSIEQFDRLWARAEVTVEYHDEKGKKRTLHGENSTLLMIPPNDVALTAGPGIGPNILWVGCDESRYWLFDLRDQGTVYYGYRENLRNPETQPLPAPIYPQQLPLILGLRTIDPEKPPAEPAVEWLNGYYLIEPPDSGTRVLIDPKTSLPVRIDLLDRSGYSILAARLSQPGQVTNRGISPSLFPKVSTEIESWLLYQNVHVTLKLKDMTNGRDNPKINRAFEGAFDFQNLHRAFEPFHEVDLDVPQTTAGQ